MRRFAFCKKKKVPDKEWLRVCGNSICAPLLHDKNAFYSNEKRERLETPMLIVLISFCCCSESKVSSLPPASHFAASNTQSRIQTIRLKTSLFMGGSLRRSGFPSQICQSSTRTKSLTCTLTRVLYDFFIIFKFFYPSYSIWVKLNKSSQNRANANSFFQHAGIMGRADNHTFFGTTS